MKTNLLTTIKTSAETAGYHFLYGDGRYFEQKISQLQLDQKIGLMLNIISSSPAMENNMWNGELDYSVQMFLFRKFEPTTLSSLNETLEQKFESRLDELQTELLTFLGRLTQCNNDITMIAPRLEIWTNRGSVNVDGWYFEGTLKLFNQFPNG